MSTIFQYIYKYVDISWVTVVWFNLLRLFINALENAWIKTAYWWLMQFVRWIEALYRDTSIDIPVSFCLGLISIENTNRNCFILNIYVLVIEDFLFFFLFVRNGLKGAVIKTIYAVHKGSRKKSSLLVARPLTKRNGEFSRASWENQEFVHYTRPRLHLYIQYNAIRSVHFWIKCRLAFIDWNSLRALETKLIQQIDRLKIAADFLSFHL